MNNCNHRRQSWAHQDMLAPCSSLFSAAKTCWFTESFGNFFQSPALRRDEGSTRHELVSTNKLRLIPGVCLIWDEWTWRVQVRCSAVGIIGFFSSIYSFGSFFLFRGNNQKTSWEMEAFAAQGKWEYCKVLRQQRVIPTLGIHASQNSSPLPAKKVSLKKLTTCNELHRVQKLIAYEISLHYINEQHNV
jgi:hypothetical protein